jgi:hypothetical protein
MRRQLESDSHALSGSLRRDVTGADQATINCPYRHATNGVPAI